MRELPPRVRRASPSDADDLVRLGRLTFEAAFGDQNTPEDMAAYLDEAFAPGRIAEELIDPRVTYLLAEWEGKLLGYAKLRATEADASVQGPQPIEIERLYAHPDAIGTGIGAGLMEACLAVARAGAFRTVWLGVWEHNARAISFYERWAFVRTGEHPFMLGSDEQTDVIMERAVAPLSSQPPV